MKHIQKLSGGEDGKHIADLLASGGATITWKEGVPSPSSDFDGSQEDGCLVITLAGEKGWWGIDIYESEPWDGSLSQILAHTRRQ
jgi:hypothetical protein